MPVLELSRPPEASVEAKAEFRKIYEAHFDQVWHSLRRLSVAERDLMDATQNVFVVVFRKLHEFEGRAQLRTWIFQICRRVASDYRRSAPVRREVVTDSIELNARAEQMGGKLVARLKQVKEERGIGFLDPAREEWMLQYLTRANRGPLSPEGLQEIYTELLDLTKREVARGESG